MMKRIFLVVAVLLLVSLSLGMGPPTDTNKKTQANVRGQDQTVTTQQAAVLTQEATGSTAFAKAPDTAAVVYAVYIISTSEKGAFIPDGIYMLTAIGPLGAALSTA